MVRAQAMLIDRLGIDDAVLAVGRRLDGRHAGAAMDRKAYPERVFSRRSRSPARPATRRRNIAFHELGRQAVMADPELASRRPLSRSKAPIRIAVSRWRAWPRISPIMSDAALHRKFGRRFQDRELPTFSFDADFEVESYLRYQGSSFVERFDANSYLYLTRAMGLFRSLPRTT
jgi:homoserine O-acetyltransferase